MLRRFIDKCIDCCGDYESHHYQELEEDVVNAHPRDNREKHQHAKGKRRTYNILFYCVYGLLFVMGCALTVALSTMTRLSVLGSLIISFCIMFLI